MDGGYRVSRRGLLAGGVLATSGLARSAECAASIPRQASRREISCIFLWLGGGPSSLDLWDPKPYAPSEIRGPFRPIATNVPGIQVCEHLPRCATIADKYCLVRSVTHAREDHEGAAQVNAAGWDSWPAQVRRPFGAMLEQLLGSPGSTPFHVRLPVHAASIASGAPTVPGGLNRQPAAGWPFPYSEGAGPCAGSGELDALLSSARRLVESGVRFVTVVGGGWDTHTHHFSRLQEDLLPNLDRALYRLLTDLEDRGMLTTTLVVVTGEFSRTPRINRDGGRDHWSQVQTVLLAGGGISGGAVLGASDEHGAFPAARPVAAHDLAATLYHKFGIPPGREFLSPDGLRLPLLPDGAKPIHELL